MNLPHGKNAFISREKLTKYVLSETHVVGRFKARFFRKFGFDETNVGFFEKSLRKLAQSQDIKEALSTPYGTKYIIDGKIETPSGKSVKIRTVWILEEGQERPRFITVFPV